MAEILKSWWHRLRFPAIFYFRNKDKREVDFLIKKDQKNYPIEVKLGATPKKEWLKSFATLRVLKEEIGPDCVISLTNMVFPFDAKNYAIPAGII